MILLDFPIQRTPFWISRTLLDWRSPWDCVLYDIRMFYDLFSWFCVDIHFSFLDIIHFLR